MRLPDAAHTQRPWRIHELAYDFRLEDVWTPDVTGDRDGFRTLVETMAAGDTSSSPSPIARALFALRWQLGELFGWDEEEKKIGARVPTLRDRLPDDLLDGPTGPDFATLPFSSLYQTDDEWAAEIANGTMHGIMHWGLVPQPGGGHRIQMAVLVKPNGMFGTAYMAAIKPFRLLFVYPALMRQIERQSKASSTRRETVLA